MINEVLYSCIIIKMCFIWYLTYIHACRRILINAQQELTNFVQPLYKLEYVRQ